MNPDPVFVNVGVEHAFQQPAERKTMNIYRKPVIVTLLVVAALAGCQSEITGPDMNLSRGEQLAASGTADVVGFGFIWADGVLHRTVATPAHFKPDHGPVDVLYNTGGHGTFKDGIEAISEAKPGDTDYNGGRWQVMFLKQSVDPGKYADASADWDLDPADFEVSGVYFVCPLQRPKKN